MVKDRINKKYAAWIWFALIFASIVRNGYSLYEGFSDGFGDAKIVTAVLNTILNLLLSGFLPAFLCYLCASIMHSMAWRRNLKFISRNDFIYITMLFGTVTKLVVGVINLFGIIVPEIPVYGEAFLDEVVLTAALYVMFFAVLMPKYDVNPKMKSNLFSTWAWIYVVFQGLNTVVTASASLICFANPELTERILELYESYTGLKFTLDSNVFAASIAAIVIFAVIVIITAVVGALLRKKAQGFVEPEPEAAVNQPGQNPAFTGNPFDEFRSGDVSGVGGDVKNGNVEDSGNVFDEFDI